MSQNHGYRLMMAPSGATFRTRINIYWTRAGPHLEAQTRIMKKLSTVKEAQIQLEPKLSSGRVAPWSVRRGTRATKLFNLSERREMKLKTLKDLYRDELRDVYDAENQIVKAIPKMVSWLRPPNLRKLCRNIWIKRKDTSSASTRYSSGWERRRRARHARD